MRVIAEALTLIVIDKGLFLSLKIAFLLFDREFRAEILLVIAVNYARFCNEKQR